MQRVNENGYDRCTLLISLGSPVSAPDDPGHTWEHTAEQIYGRNVSGTEKPRPKMNGFVQNALELHNTPFNPMSMFNKTTAPIINTLATEFVVFDKWYNLVHFSIHQQGFAPYLDQLIPTEDLR